MTVANDIISLSLRNAAVVGVGQTPLPDDVNDALTVLNAWINEINLERTVKVNRVTLPVFPDLTTDVPFWGAYEHVLLTSMAVRLRQVYSLPAVQLDVQLAASALTAFNAINLEQIAAPTIAADDGTGYGVIFLALRAAGRVKDDQGVLQSSQDVTDAHSLLNEMIDEWQRERAVKVIPGTLATISDLTAPLAVTSGEKNALVLNLAVRLRDWVGAETPKPLLDRADRALALLQAINLQQNPALSIAADDGTGFGIVFLALRAAGRVTDDQGILQTSQDVTDAHSLLNEMLDEWNRERAVKVIPGTLPTIPNLSAAISLPTGQKNAVVLGLAVRLRDWVGAEIPKPLLDRAERALALIQAINLQQNSAVTIAGNDGTGYGILYLALRAAGRVNDGQGVLQTSQDMTDAYSLLQEMLDEWQRERTVKVIPGTFLTIPDLTIPLGMPQGERNAIVLNLAVRLRDWFGAEVPKQLLDRAERALALIQAINLQQNPAPIIAADDGTGYGIIFLALRAAGRVTDDQGVLQTSQDVSDAGSMLREMLDEWQRERTVKVIPGLLPQIFNLAAPLALDQGVRNAIVLNLTVRLRDAFGAEVSKTLFDRAATALGLIQAINQQQIAPLHAGVPETVVQAIFLALRMAGRINDQQSVADTSKDVNDAFSLLVMMLAQWQRKRWLIWNEQEVSLVSTGADYYTIGPGKQDFVTARPDKIHAAFCRILATGGGGGSTGAMLPALLPFVLGAEPTATAASGNSVDLSLAIIEAKEDWATIAIKDLKSIPAAVFYDSDWPIGRLYFWPVPPANAYELHVIVKASLPVYATLDDQLFLPPEYLDALVNNLACRIIVTSGGQISPFLAGQARASLETIRLANSQIPLLSMPAALSGHRGGDYSSWAGAGLGQAWIIGGTSTLG